MSEKDLLREDDYQPTAFHPKSIMLTLMLMGVGALFVALSAAYVYNRVQHPEIPPIKLPPLFLINTLILLGSSYTLIQAKKAYRADNTEGYKQNLIYTLILSGIFFVAQCIAWRILFANDINFQHSNTASYLIIISIVHLLHVVAGIPFLAVFYYTAKKRMVEPVSVLIYFSDPAKKLNLRLLTVYWHFLDALWIYLVIFFGISYFIN
jgi:Heme/copper-type cytochrome/quinol oxidase, subunit 3